MLVFWKSFIRAGLSTKVSVVSGDEAFELRSGKKILSTTRWSEVERATAFKTGLVTTDLICVRFDRTATELSPVVHEEMIGFAEFTGALPAHLPGIDPVWYPSVMLPPFARNERVIWSRSAEH